METNPEIKVGILTLVSLVGLFSIFFWLNRVDLLNKGTETELVFERIDNIRPGAPVKYLGVDVGRVTKLYFEKGNIIVVVKVNQGFKLPLTSEAIITSSGVVGDKYIDIYPLKPGKKPLPDKRIQGVSPTSMDQLFASASELVASLKQTVDSVNQIVSNPAMAASINNSLANIQKITAATNELITNNRSVMNDLIHNAASASQQLAQASATANRLLQEVDANGANAKDLRQIISHIQNIAANFDNFSASLASKGPETGKLIDDAHQTMQSINAVAQNVNGLMSSLSTTEGSAPDVKQALSQAGIAAKKVSTYVMNFSKITTVHSIGAGYRSVGASENLTVNYQMGLNLNEKRGLDFGIEDIGYDNLATLQYKIKQPAYDGRVGIYQNQFGLGIDLKPASSYCIGVNLWDTHSAKLGLNTRWQVNPDWYLTLSASSKLQTWDSTWNIGWWRKF